MKTYSGTSQAAGRHQLGDVAGPCQRSSLLPRQSQPLPPIPRRSSPVLFTWWPAGEERAAAAGSERGDLRQGRDSWGRNGNLPLAPLPVSAAPSAAFLVSARGRRDPLSAVRRGCDARDALRSAVGSGQALRGHANPPQESSCGLFQIPSLNWLIRAGRSVWRGRQHADTCAAVGEGRLLLQGSDEERLVLPLPSQTSASSPASLPSKPWAVLGRFPMQFLVLFVLP